MDKSSDAFIANIRRYDAIERCHSHAHHQIILPLSGTLELAIESRSGQVRALQGAVVPGDFRHAFRGVGDNRFVVVDLPSDLSAGHSSDDLRRFLDTPNFFALDPSLYHYSHLVSAELARDVPDPTLSTGLAGLLAELLARRRPTDAAKPIRLARRLGPALQYIDTHLDRRISVSTLAALSCLSVGRFHAAFRDYTARAPGQYVAELRMQRAIALVQENAWSVARVAAAVGYSSQAAFTHAFQRYFGFSPRRYLRHANARARDGLSS